MNFFDKLLDKFNKTYYSEIQKNLIENYMSLKDNPIDDQKNVLKNKTMSPSAQLSSEFKLDETEQEQLEKVFKQITTSQKKNERPEEDREMICEDDIKMVLGKLLEQDGKEAVPVNKDEIALMIWEVDDDLDGKISKPEFMMAYKRVIVDLNDMLEPRKFYHLVEFLMQNLFDQSADDENLHTKKTITEEDCYKLMYIKNKRQRNNSTFKQDKQDTETKELFQDNQALSYTDFINRKMKILMKERHEMRKDKIDTYKNKYKELGDKGK